MAEITWFIVGKITNFQLYEDYDVAIMSYVEHNATKVVEYSATDHSACIVSN